MLVLAFSAILASGFRPVNVNGPEHLALGGYDVVYLHERGELIRGAPYLEARWHGATWRFASQRSREAFLQEPERYLPRYGGYCALCVSEAGGGGEDAQPTPSDPTAYFVYRGHVYLFQNQALKEQFARSPEVFIARADQYWERWRREGKIDAVDAD